MSDYDNHVLLYDTVFAYKGQAGVWAGTAASIITNNPDEDISFGHAKLVAESMVLKVRRSDVATAAKGDAVTVGDMTYIVTDTPKFDDRYRLVWVAMAKVAG